MDAIRQILAQRVVDLQTELAALKAQNDSLGPHMAAALRRVEAGCYADGSGDPRIPFEVWNDVRDLCAKLK